MNAMPHTLTIATIVGSLRAASYSRRVLHAVRETLPVGTDFVEIGIGQLPLYNSDLDTADAPEAVRTARRQVATSNLLLLVVPEYNHGIPGVVKNALDWLSRPAFDSCCIGKTAVFITLSEGALGGVRAQHQLRETLSSMLCVLPPMREIAITGVQHKLDGARFGDADTQAFIAASLGDVLAGVQAGIVARKADAANWIDLATA
jgi:chromate reductase